MAKKIYIAEDQPLHAELIQSALEANGYQLVVFNDGLSVYQEVQENIPDLLILDIILPNLSGLAVSSLLKFHDKYAKLPILIISSITDPNLKELTQKTGADAFMPKPFKVRDLSEKVAQLLQKNDIKTLPI